VEGRLLLDVVVAEGAAIFELLSGEDKTLLIGGDSFLILDLLLDLLDGITGFNLEGDGLASKGLDENLHFCLREQNGQRRVRKPGLKVQLVCELCLSQYYCWQQ